MAQTDCRYRVRHDSSTRTTLRDLSLYAHRYGRVDGRNPYGCCRCNPASYFPATGGRRGYPDAARDRQPRRAGDGLCCRNGLVCRPDLSLTIPHPVASTVNTQRKVAPNGLPAEQWSRRLRRTQGSGCGKAEIPEFCTCGAGGEVDMGGEAASRIEASQLMGSRAKMVVR